MEQRRHPDYEISNAINMIHRTAQHKGTLVTHRETLLLLRDGIEAKMEKMFNDYEQAVDTNNASEEYDSYDKFSMMMIAMTKAMMRKRPSKLIGYFVKIDSDQFVVRKLVDETCAICLTKFVYEDVTAPKTRPAKNTLMTPQRCMHCVSNGPDGNSVDEIRGCLHVMHHGCLVKWTNAEQPNSNACPICKTKFML